jgi:hypothetical protein
MINWRVCVLALALGTLAVPLWAAPTTLEIPLSPAQTRVDVPVEVDWTPPLGDDSWQLEEVGAGAVGAGAGVLLCQRSAAQAGEGQPASRLYFLLPPSPSEQPVTRKFQLVQTTDLPGPAFRWEDQQDGRLVLTEGERSVLTYVYGMTLPAGVPAQFRRACYVHPLCDLDGHVLTDDFPKDHYHHRGLFWTWPVVRVGDATYDLWALEGMEQRFERYLGREAGPVYAALGAEAGWFHGEQKVIQEAVWLRVFRAGEVGRAIDLELTLAAVGSPVTRGGRPGKGYGDLTLRFAPREGTVLHSSEGPEPQDADQRIARWADLSAQFLNPARPAGAAIFNSPGNPTDPVGWTLRPYGILNPAWPGTGEVTLQPGQSVTLRYRLWIHRGNVEAGHVADAYEAFANPPQARVK